MAETTTPVRTRDENEVVERARDFWTRNSKVITIVALVVILAGGGYLIWKNFVQAPKEQKASEQIFKAEDYFRSDSLQLALNGDGMNPGFLRIIDNYGGTRSGELARYYAGAIYLQLGDFPKAEKHLKGFNTDARQVQARAYKLLGDAYAEQGKNKDALSSYKKAARHFEKDEMNASEYYFLAAYFADQVVKNRDEAVSLYRELKKKYPRTEKGFEAEKYLARLGEYRLEK